MDPILPTEATVVESGHPAMEAVEIDDMGPPCPTAMVVAEEEVPSCPSKLAGVVVDSGAPSVVVVADTETSAWSPTMEAVWPSSTPTPLRPDLEPANCQLQTSRRSSTLVPGFPKTYSQRPK